VAGLPAAFVLTLALLASACSQSDSALQKAIAGAVAVGDGTVFRMSDLAEFEWDRLHVIPPYTASDEIDRELGFHWPSAQSTGIEQRDDIALLVFVRGAEVVRYVDFPRRDGDFSAVDRPGGFSRKAAIFAVRQEPGEPGLSIRELNEAGG
jgi:hypothetical protein